MGIHYDYKSTRGAKAMEKQAKREKKLAEKRAKKQAKAQEKGLVEKIKTKGYVQVENIKGKDIQVIEYELTNQTIIEKNVKKNIGEEKKKLKIQPLGIMVIEYLIDNFNFIRNLFKI